MLASAEDTSVLSPRSRMNQAQQEVLGDLLPITYTPVTNAACSQLSRVVQALVHIGEQFNQAIVDSANEVTVYKSRITELECRNHEIHSTASEAAFRKLQHVKCVMRTLLEEIGFISPTTMGCQINPHPRPRAPPELVHQATRGEGSTVEE
ncbi:hypothetical protein ID866_2560 [Astraeus odoratus]|nr:hypothetical protein ID866_2560 [Astraeus odoratus]